LKPQFLIPAAAILLLAACAAPGQPTTEAPPTAAEATSPPETATEPPAGPAHLLAGLTFSTASGFWRVDALGTPILLEDQPRGDISADGRYLAFQEPDESGGKDDIFLLDLETGEKRNLTNTPDRFDEEPAWWPGQPEVVVFGSDVECCMASRALPTIVRADGTGYTVLDEQEGGPRAFSPDGQLMAYGGYDALGKLYQWAVGSEVFDPAANGLAVERLLTPAFSADGRVLAWKVSGDLTGAGKYELGFGLFDLETGTARLLHVYEPVGGASMGDYLAWSADGQWLVVVTQDEQPAMSRVPNLFAARTDGSGDQFIAFGTDPTWNPAGSILAYLQATESGGVELWLADPVNWSTRPADIAIEEMILYLGEWEEQ
jgi:Tol biopolymer transport system component